jgi:hypothetical protein
MLKNFNDISFNKQTNIYIFGDSHVKCFLRNEFHVNNISIYNNCRSTTSMYGMRKNASTTNYKSFIDENIEHNEESCNNYYIYKFGQVDIEYIFHYKLIKLEKKIDKIQFYLSAIKPFIKLLNSYKQINPNIYVCGVNFLNPSDGWRSYLRKTIKTDWKTFRKYNKTFNLIYVNNNAILFNALLKNECLDNDIEYFDLLAETSIIEDNHIAVNPLFVGLDNHYKGAEIQGAYERQKEKCENYGELTNYTFLKKLFDTIHNYEKVIS